MKSPFLLTPILAITLSLIPWQSKGLTQAPCFLQGPDGRQIDLGGLCGGGQNSVQPSTNRPADSYQIPIKRRLNGIPTVEVVINGQHRFEMLFDTGASVVVLDQGMANKIGLNDSKPVGFAQTAGGMVPVSAGRLQTLTVGALKKQNVEAMITQDLGMPGLLGQNFFGGYDVTIRESVIELRRR